MRSLLSRLRVAIHALRGRPIIANMHLVGELRLHPETRHALIVRNHFDLTG